MIPFPSPRSDDALPPASPASPVGPVRRQPSPLAEQRRGDVWRVRIGLVVIAAVCTASATLASRLIHGIHG